MWVALGAAFRELSYSGVRAIVLTGAGGEFCSGADLASTKRSGDARARGNAWSTRCASSPTSCWPSTTARFPSSPRSTACVSARVSGLALAADLTWCSDRSPLLADLREARAQPRLRNVVVAPAAHRRAQGEGAGVHREDAQRRRSVRARAGQCGRAGRRARRRHGRDRRDDRRRAADRARRRRSASSTPRRRRRSRRPSRLEGLAQSFNASTDDMREAFVRVHRTPAREVHGPVDAAPWPRPTTPAIGARSSTTCNAAATRRARWAAKNGSRNTAPMASSTLARGSSTSSTPGRSRSSARSSAATKHRPTPS